jgi:hypothetical protein
MEGDQHRAQGLARPKPRSRNFKKYFHMDSICPGALAKVGGMMNANTNQMELGLRAKQARLTARQKQRRQQRAQWWFAQMRRVVDTALEWKPSKSGREEQVCLSLSAKRS